MAFIAVGTERVPKSASRRRLVFDMSTTSTQKIVVTARVQPDLLAELRQIAASQNRSLGGQIRHALGQHVQQEQKRAEIYSSKGWKHVVRKDPPV